MKAFITVMGHDTVGVVAKVSGLCSELNINIEDVTQSILQGMFAMIMLVDVSSCSMDFTAFAEKMKQKGDELGVDVHPDRYARRLRAFCKKNGLPHVAPKYFRHTFRVNTRKADIPEQDIQKMLGHKEFETSFIYMELDEDVLREDQRAHERLILRA